MILDAGDVLAILGTPAQREAFCALMAGETAALTAPADSLGGRDR